MIDDRTKAQRADEEAAAWYAKLSAGRVGNDELARFFDWRSQTLNDAAYSRIEGLTTATRALADDPRLQALASQALERPREAQVRSRRVVTLSLGAGAIMAAVAASFVFVHPGEQTYRTALGERRAISLEDGSSVALNTQSQVRVRYSKDRRDLVLDKGQALFSVAHDRGRPFVVKAGDTAVLATGTRFEVYRKADEVDVTLAEGRVEVSKTRSKAPPVVLSAGQRLAVTPRATTPVRSVDVAAATGWTNGRLIFRDAPLAEAVAEVNRYSRRRIELSPDAPATQRVNGVFDAGDTEAFVEGVTMLLGLRATRQDGGVTRLSRQAG
ncbi:FecR family protein [Caulobacter sp. 602-2]|uniref:FecR family protein n=1 Tax=Caulobacter sp. 602-2 TaxID=2710887 RepID=A0A6G4QVV6_9CAUL|nr:FecR family protein [Caulobacter sp. 602-2]NGM49375.1 FecR family protein [Caulobacter sp. 602-2]